MSSSSISVSPTSPSRAGAGLTLFGLPLTPVSSKGLVQNRSANVCRMGYHPGLGGNTRLSALPQRPLLGTSRCRGHSPEWGRSPLRGCTHRGRRSRRHPRERPRPASRTSPGKGEQSTSGLALWRTARGPQDAAGPSSAGEDFQIKDAGSSEPAGRRGSHPGPVQGGVASPGSSVCLCPHHCPPCPAARGSVKLRPTVLHRCC